MNKKMLLKAIDNALNRLEKKNDFTCNLLSNELIEFNVPLFEIKKVKKQYAFYFTKLNSQDAWLNTEYQHHFNVILMGNNRHLLNHRKNMLCLFRVFVEQDLKF